jgi:hypothetical protein
MRLPDPFTDSNAPGFLSINITDNSTIIQDELPNNQVLQVDTGNHFWGINITYDQLLPEEFEIIRSFCFKAKVTNSTIEVLLPQFENYKFMLDSYSVKAGLSGNSIVEFVTFALSKNYELFQTLLEVIDHRLYLYPRNDYQYLLVALGYLVIHLEL